MFTLKSFLARLWLRAVHLSLVPFSDRTKAWLLEQVAMTETPKVERLTRHGPIHFHCPGALPFWRADTLLTKEPDTIAWLDSLPENSVLWDVGANVGVYTLYAARAGCRVIAFEPCINNYELLCRNLALNGLEERTQAFCLAFSDTTRTGVLNLPSTQAGSALLQFGERQDTVEVLNQQAAVVFRQMSLGYAPDEFLAAFDPSFPAAMKIDVDGLEHAIIAGAAKIFTDERFRTLLVELDMRETNITEQTLERIEAAGLRLTSLAAAALADKRKAGETCNLIFWKQAAPHGKADT